MLQTAKFSTLSPQVFLSFLIFIFVTSSVYGLTCSETQKAGNCYCSPVSQHANISYSVPVSHKEHKKFNMKVEPSEYVQMTCNPDITMIDIIPNLKGLEIGDIKVFSRLNCPVPVDPLQT